MRFDEEFRRGEHAGRILTAMRNMHLPPTTIMEVCGTHTMAIAKAGIRDFLPEGVRLISGPGCPVCVTTAGEIDEILRISMEKNVIIATYGDLMRVPGSRRGDNLQRRRALGADVRMVYSPMDALEMAAQNPERKILFLGVGFETTSPGTAMSVLQAQRRGVKNFFLLSLLKKTEPALRALAARPDFSVDGFICPGHVATIIGAEAFRFLPDEHGLGAVIAGFETQDVACALYRLLLQMQNRAPRLENEYTRAVSPEGNPAAMAVVAQVMQPCGASWRGLGEIPGSGLALRSEFSAYDGAAAFDYHPEPGSRSTACRCGT